MSIKEEARQYAEYIKPELAAALFEFLSGKPVQPRENVRNFKIHDEPKLQERVYEREIDNESSES